MSEAAGTPSPKLEAPYARLRRKVGELRAAPQRIEYLEARVRQLEQSTAELYEELQSTRRALEESADTARSLRDLLEASERRLADIATAQAQLLNRPVAQTGD